MPRRLIAFALFACALQAQIWPQSWHGSKRINAAPAAVADPMLWREYGGQAAERAVYDGPVGVFAATAWRLQDATGALAWYQANRPAKCVPLRGALSACLTPSGQMIAHQNYVFLFDGWRPFEREMAALYHSVPALRSGGGLPYLPGYLPEKRRVPNSERYLLGVHSLAKFLPSVPAALAGFEDGAEVAAVKLNLGQGVADYAIFYFHTPQLARLKAREFAKRPGWLVKRSGVLVGVFPGGATGDAAKPILDALKWQAEVVRNEASHPPLPPNVAGLLIAIFELTGVLLVFCMAGGVVFAFIFSLLRKRRVRLQGNDNPMTLMRIG